MKKLASHLIRAKVVSSDRARRPREETRNEVPITPLPPLKEEKRETYQDIPDAWDVKHRPDMERRAERARKELQDQVDTRRRNPERVEPEEEGDPSGYVEVEVKKRRIKRDKRRRNTLSFAVSDEEEAILRAHLAKLDVSLSSWVRQTLFRAMGKKVPARPRKP
jgi:plasmid stabilization system protein ParE